jgi:2-polyprenyl-3-methyl-5-hydroxy-6-metoxy-1,4-benzoquinol methylase
MRGDEDYVRRYFSEHAREWLSAAYADETHPTVYPLGQQRIRLALAAAIDRLGSSQGHLVDFGCGGGDLCLRAALAGFRVTGIDIAERMIECAESRKRERPQGIRDRLTFMAGDVLRSGLPDESADAVTALGLIEYMEEDEAFFKAAARVLRPGGVLAVSCRNRLFNVMSCNAYTEGEVRAGTFPALVAELVACRPSEEARHLLGEFVSRLRAALAALEEALALDCREQENGMQADRLPVFTEFRRQHTPAQLAQAAEAAGFGSPSFVGIHPQPLSPDFEGIAPRFYNRLASVFEALESSPASLRCSSAFLGVFTKWAR